MRKITLFWALCFLAFYSNAQQISFEQIIDQPVSGLKNPWAGGFNSVQFFQMDLDEDGKQDLVVFNTN